MTIRSGGRPRDSRAAQARPYDPDAYATETIPEFSQPVPGGRRGRGGRGSSVVGLIKFLVFALVLAALVIAVALTALRPAVADAVMSIADDNPAALQLPFVKDIVAEKLGPSLTTPVSADTTQVEFLVEQGDTAKSIATKLETAGLIGDSRAFVFIATEQNLTGSLQAGDVHPAQEHDPGPARQRAPGARARAQVRGHRPAHGSSARADDRQARDAPAPDGRVRVPRHRDLAAGRAASTTTRGSRRSWPTRRKAPRSKGSCGRRPTASSRTPRRRSSSA